MRYTRDSELVYNGLEGRRYQSFTTRCAATVKEERFPFIIVPMTGGGAPLSSWAVCPEGSGGL